MTHCESPLERSKHFAFLNLHKGKDFPVGLSASASGTLFFFNVCFYLFIWLCWVLFAACWVFSCSMQDLVLPALGKQSLSHWITREVPLKKKSYWNLLFWYSLNISKSIFWRMYLLSYKRARLFMCYSLSDDFTSFFEEKSYFQVLNRTSFGF